jgi:hypothetical protein
MGLVKTRRLAAMQKQQRAKMDRKNMKIVRKATTKGVRNEKTGLT